MSRSDFKLCTGTKAAGDETKILSERHWESRENFSKHSKNKDGLDSRCRACMKLYNASKKLRPKVTPPEFMTCRLCGETKHHSEMQNNSNTRNGKDAFCLECASAESSGWQKANPEKKRANVQRRREREAEVYLQDVLITELLERYDSKCVYCEASVDIKTGVHEHVVPVINGGFGANFNAVLACQSCNSSKGGRAYHTWFDTHHDKRKIIFYPDLYLWSSKWNGYSLELQKYREVVKSPGYIKVLKSNPELLEHDYLKNGLAAESVGKLLT